MSFGPFKINDQAELMEIQGTVMARENGGKLDLDPLFTEAQHVHRTVSQDVPHSYG